MSSLDMRFNDYTISLLRSFIGMKLDKVAFFMLPYTIEIHGMVVLQINGVLYSLTSYYEPLDYLGNGVDDVGVLKFQETSRSVIEEYESFICPPQKLPETIVGQEIAEIEIVNENREMFDQGVLFGSFDMVKGIVFKMKDGLEIAFEKDNYDTEFIKFRKGHDLIKEFESIEDEFIEEWKDVENVRVEGTRTTLVLK